MLTLFLTFFFLHTLRHDFVPWVMISLPTLRNEIITGGNDFAPSGMILSACCDEIEQAKKGVCMQKGEVSHSWDPLFYSKHTTTIALMWCGRRWMVVFSYACLGRWPVR